MKVSDFFKDRALFLMVNLFLFILVLLLMISVKTGMITIFVVWCIWFLPLLGYLILDYIRWNNYLKNMQNSLGNLDKKYLLPEVMEDGDFLIAEEINKIIKALSRDMHENVKHYREIQEEYREYIETWVHEIKTPIASSKLLIENNNNDVTKKIDMQIDKIDNYVEQVLYYSRSNEVGKDYIIQEVSIEDVVKKVVKRNFRNFLEKNIKLQLTDIKETVFCDPKWMEFIINQVISNSIKYCNTKGAVIKIYVVNEKNSVSLNIEDNGVGIVERDLKRVFEKGFTGENGRIFGMSTGMGLYLCKKLCNKLGLAISISSQEEKGTIVMIVFPKNNFVIK